MEYIHLLVWLGLIYIEGCKGRSLLHGESQEQAFDVRVQQGQSQPIGGLVRGGGLESSEDEPGRGRQEYRPATGAVIRKSFSLETTTQGTTPHFEALTGRNGSWYRRQEDEDDFRFSSPSYSYSRPTYSPLSYVRRDGTSVSGSLQRPAPPPSVHVQRVPLRRQWTTEPPNAINEEDLDGRLGSFSYATPSPSPRASFGRGEVRYTSPAEPPYGPARSGKQLPDRFFDQDRRRVYIEPTTFRPPLFKPISTTGQYAFSFRAGNNSRDEIGNSNGHFRGSVKFRDTQGFDKEVVYAGEPGSGLVTSEVPVVRVAGRSGYVSEYPSSTLPPPRFSTVTPFLSTPFPSTPFPFTRDRGAYSYSYMTSAPSVTPIYDNVLRYGKSTTDGYQPSEGGLPTPDGSYAFSYNAGDSERKETRDSEGNVRGMYSFMTPEGEKKLVRYAADAENGFMARGQHLPVQEARLVPGSGGDPADRGTYYFSYDAGDHSRQEVRDTNGNVEGSFSFLTADGLKQVVSYEANPQDGFRIKSTHISNSGQYK